MPGTAARASDALTRSWVSPICAASTTSMAAGRSKLACSARVALTTTTLIWLRTSSAAAASGPACAGGGDRIQRNRVASYCLQSFDSAPWTGSFHSSKAIYLLCMDRAHDIGMALALFNFGTGVPEMTVASPGCVFPASASRCGAAGAGRWHGLCEREGVLHTSRCGQRAHQNWHINNLEDDMNLADISKLGIANPFKQRYDNYIGGKFVAPVKGEYFDNITPDHRPAVLRSCRAPPPKTSSWRWMPRTRPRTHGARPRRPSAPTS